MSERVRDTKNLSVFFFIPVIIFALFSLSLHRTQIRGHTAQALPPLLATVRALHFYGEKNKPLSSLVDWRRIVPTHAVGAPGS